MSLSIEIEDPHERFQALSEILLHLNTDIVAANRHDLSRMINECYVNTKAKNHKLKIFAEMYKLQIQYNMTFEQSMTLEDVVSRTFEMRGRFGRRPQVHTRQTGG